MDNNINNEIEYRIVNGNDVNNINTHSYFAALKIKGYDVPFCGGSYVGKNIVITAAHCLDVGLKASDLVVQFKKENITDPGIEYQVNRILIHPNFNINTLNNDIAIIFLNGKPWQNGIKKLLLPTFDIKKNLYKVGKKCVILGYGYTSENGYNSFKLQRADIKIISKNSPLNFYQPGSITKNMVLAGDFANLDNPNDNKDACSGDSGGPMFTWFNKKRYLNGLVSWGYGCAVDLYPGVYTKVGNYRRWIRNNAKV